MPTNGLGGYPQCDDPKDEIEVPSQCEGYSCTSMYIPPRCVRVTKTLYIDNQRIGVIREVEEK